VVVEGALIMKKAVLTALALAVTVATVNPAFAQSPQKGKISGRSVLAGVTSLLIWPGIGQAINDQPGDKVATHAILGLLPPVRFWSGYDALVDRSGGYWKGRI